MGFFLVFSVIMVGEWTSRDLNEWWLPVHTFKLIRW